MKKEILLNGIVVGEVEATGDFKKDAQTVSDYLKEKGLQREISEPDSIHGQANSFAETANTIYAKHLKTSPYYGPSTAPFIVNAVFSIELYLKCMRRYCGEKVRGHNLESLYKGLPKEAKGVLIEAAEEVRPRYKLETGTTILTALSDLSKAFEQWRYVYENNGLTTEIQSIRYTMHSCHEACCRVANKKRITNGSS